MLCCMSIRHGIRGRREKGDGVLRDGDGVPEPSINL